MAQSDNQEQKLSKALTPLHVWALAFGAIIGWGCFVLPGDFFLPQAGPLATIIAFFLGAILLAFVAVTYSYMIEYVPVAGGEYAYAYVGFGPTAAFICGWALVLGYIAIIALSASAMTFLVRYFMPSVFEIGELYTIVGWKVYVGEVIFMYAMILLFGALNYRGVSMAGKTQVFLACCLSAGVLLLFFGVFFMEGSSISNLEPLYAPHRSPWLSIAAVLAIAPFLYVGFDCVPQAAEEFAFPVSKSRNIMLIAILWGAILYSLVTLAVGMAIPYPELLAQMDMVKQEGGIAWATAVVVKMAYGDLGAYIISLAVLGATCTGINGFYVATSRLLLSMARGGILPQWFAAIHPKYKTPHNAIIFCIITVLVTPWCGRAVVGWIVDMSSVGTGIAYLFTSLVAYRVVKNIPAAAGAGKTLVCIIGIIASTVIILLLIVPGSPGFISFAPRIAMVIWVVLGIIFYFKSKPTWSSMPEAELRKNVLGDPNLPVFFKVKD